MPTLASGHRTYWKHKQQTSSFGIWSMNWYWIKDLPWTNLCTKWPIWGRTWPHFCSQEPRSPHDHRVRPHHQLQPTWPPRARVKEKGNPNPWAKTPREKLRDDRPGWQKLRFRARSSNYVCNFSQVDVRRVTSVSLATFVPIHLLLDLRYAWCAQGGGRGRVLHEQQSS